MSNIRVSPILGPSPGQSFEQGCWDTVNDPRGINDPTYGPGTRFTSTAGADFIYAKASGDIAAESEFSINPDTFETVSGTGFSAISAVPSGSWFPAKINSGGGSIPPVNDYTATIEDIPASTFLSSNFGKAGYRDETERLETATYVGHDADLTLKIPGVAATPAGMTINGNDITIDNSFDNTLSDDGKTGDPAGWDFTSANVIDNRTEVVWSHCLFSPGVLELEAATYCLDITDTATSITIRNCTGIGSQRYGHGDGFLFCNSHVAGTILIERNRLVGFASDMIKIVGGPQPMQFLQNHCEYIRNFPEDTPEWNGTTTYAKGDLVTNGTSGAFLSKVDGNLNNALPAANADNSYWLSAHADCLNIKGNYAHGAILRGNLMIGPPVADIGDSGFTVGFSGINRPFWLTANGGSTTPQRAFHIEFNVVRGKWTEAVTIYNQSAADVATPDNPHMITDNTFVGTGGSQVRYLTLYGPTIGSTCFVENNRSYQTLNVFTSHANTRAAARSNRAELPLEGTTTAPDGELIEARYLENGTPGAWQTIATVASGAWSGTLTRIPRSRQDFTAEVRVVGSTAAAAVTNESFAVGTIIWQAGASNTDKGTQVKSPTPPTIGLGAGDQQNYFYHYWDHANDRVQIATINDDDAYTASRPALRSMCAAAYHMDSDLRILFAFLSQSGSNETDALKDSQTAREWSDPLALYDSITKFGGTKKLSEIDIWYSPELMSIHLTSYCTYWNSSGSGDGYVNGDDISSEMGDLVDFVGTGPAAGYNHSWAGMTGDAFRNGRIIFYARVRQISDAINGDPNIGSQSGSFGYRLDMQDYWPHCVVNMPDHDVGKRGEEDEGINDYTHISTGSVDGFTEEFAIWMTLIGVATNMVPVRPPKFDIIQWNQNWLRLGSTAGPITTWERLENGLAATNFRGEQQQVLGFWDGGQMPTVSEIRTPNPDGSPGALAAAGDIYIYPVSGTFGAASRMYWHPDKGYPGQSGTTDGGAVVWGNDGGYRHIPIIDLGLHIRGLMPDVMWEDMDHITNSGKEDLPVVAPMTRIEAGVPSPQTAQETDGITDSRRWNNPGKVTMHFRGSVDSGKTLRLFDLNNGGVFGFSRLVGGDQRVNWAVKDNAQTTINVNSTEDGSIPAATVVDIRIVMDRGDGQPGNGSIRVWLDDVELVPPANGSFDTWDNSALATNKIVYGIGASGSGGVEPTNFGDVAWLRMWNAAYLPGDAVDNDLLYFDMTSDGNGGFVDHNGVEWPYR